MSVALIYLFIGCLFAVWEFFQIKWIRKYHPTKPKFKPGIPVRNYLMRTVLVWPMVIVAEIHFRVLQRREAKKKKDDVD
jgi:hypothetical protein